MTPFPDLESLLALVPPADEGASEAARRAMDQKTKPRGSLGRLESLACRLAASQGTASPRVASPVVVVMAADHGVAARGVSAYPPEVTFQMVLNFVRGGAAINVIARQAGARVVVADLGVAVPVENPGVEDLRLGPGTADFTAGPAMDRATAARGVLQGAVLAGRLADEGADLICTGEMGIGNTTSSSALAAVLTGAPVREVVGRGTGVDASGLARKVAAIEAGIAVNAPDPADPLGVLAALGGFEIAGLAGLILGAAARRVPVVLDGFITGAAALVAARLCPRVVGHLVASHRSVEDGHRHVLRALGLAPLLDLDLRLGEGSGAALAIPLVQSAVRVLAEMATFGDAGVTDSGA
ncbi:nicotinate-nucleotide--dimethylbenzimidazole phosphoribosyltransferase [Myxococcota bacterium]|nr:nicotinate-nucleotide--dimethylbenzimidazole phosphoribosyltransferase [Myxococcota bacterium]